MKQASVVAVPVFDPRGAAAGYNYCVPESEPATQALGRGKHLLTYTEIVGDPLWNPDRRTFVKHLRWDEQGMRMVGRPSID